MPEPNLYILLAVLAGVSGCRSQDPTKWYLTAYENEKFVFHHDHKKHIAECFQSFGMGKKTPDPTPDCTDLITMPGIGHQVPENADGKTAWVSAGSWAIFTLLGDEGPQYHLKFVSIEQDK
jgi:hypothetical protein